MQFFYISQLYLNAAVDLLLTNRLYVFDRCIQMHLPNQYIFQKKLGNRHQIAVEVFSEIGMRFVMLYALYGTIFRLHTFELLLMAIALLVEVVLLVILGSFIDRFL